MYSNQDLADTRFMYGLADSNAVVARRLYQGRYPESCPDRKTFVSIHRLLCEYGNFAPRAASRGRPRSGTTEIEDDILDVVNETPGISTRKVSLQVGVSHSTVWTVLREQLYPYYQQRVQALSLQDYSVRVMFCQWFL
jgi:hypothetical protein